MNPLDHYNFYFDVPLYQKIQITDKNQEEFYRLMVFNGNIDAYNPNLKENTTYSISPGQKNGWTYFSKYGRTEHTVLTCVRTKEVIYVYVYYDTETGIFQKIGQFPSIADFHISKIKVYDKVLNKERLKEFTRAIGLAANGVGIGSFVYLRRIFESLIEEAHIKAKTKTGWNEETYRKERMAEKIELLKAHLPEFLVENKTLYSILSVGIHNLTEQDCLAYFETVRVGIELILDEKLEQYAKLKKLEEAKKRIGNLTGKLGNK
ncbi:short-chain dehydrogenase [Cellulophaga baltica]|uniref:short-chain dehydrogenase n=1 Tax=Cellulophaga baltica TaxID=76594 RepID=UPI0015F6A940|nr:short-chain dehydrogenase [Cellulophaga baltica]MBA6316939.1 short-chain dehydrogenase [Cellulophaga baltica]